MVIATKIQQIISELQAAEELLQKQAFLNQDGNVRSAATPLSSGGNSLVQRKDGVSSHLETVTKVPDHSASQNQATLDLTSEVERLKNENQKLARELYYVRKESLISKNSEQQAISENEILVTELTKVQSELERYYEDKIALEAALESTNDLIERASATITALQQKDIRKLD